MKTRGILTTLLMLATVVLMAAPALGENKVPNKAPLVGPVKVVGLIVGGTATVGKRGTCDNEGNFVISGGGLGAPALSKPKNAWYGLKDVEILQNDAATAVLNACGKLAPVGNIIVPSGRPEKPNLKPGVGAACGASKGWDGRGRVTKVGAPTVYLSDLGWKVSGATITVTGKAVANDKTKAPMDMVVAVIQARGTGCDTKRDNFAPPIGTGKKADEHGAKSFGLNGSFVLSNGTPPDLNEMPATCKSNDPEDMCAYPEKKEPLGNP